MPERDPLVTDMSQAPGWYAILPPPRPARAPYAAGRVADWVVVGAGVTGLAAARRLAELERLESRIVLPRASIALATAPQGAMPGFIIDTPASHRSRVDTDSNRSSYHDW